MKKFVCRGGGEGARIHNMIIHYNWTRQFVVALVFADLPYIYFIRVMNAIGSVWWIMLPRVDCAIMRQYALHTNLEYI